MVLKLAVYLIFLLFLYLIPKKLWAKAFGLCHGRIFSFSLRKPYPWQELLEAMVLIDRPLSLNKEEKLELPLFKFYTPLLQKMFSLRQSYGGRWSHCLKSLRSGLIKHGQFDREVEKEIWGSLFQFLMVSAITWSFIFLTGQIAQIRISPASLFIIGFLQVVGAILFLFFSKRVEAHCFKGFSHYFASLYSLMAFSTSGVSIRESLEQSGFQELKNIQGQKFKTLRVRLQRSVDEWRHKGIPIKAELEEVIEEVWFLQNQEFIHYKKLLNGLKFVLLVCFYLGAYLIFLFCLFSQIMP